MPKTLVVVESPSKAKKIGQMLGANFIVQASGGHIRDLPTRPGENGYDPETLQPTYEVTERGKDSVKYLKAKLESCDQVLLATDPDREGEAISWHVAEVLKIKNRQRVKFHEITESAIKKAVETPAPLDSKLVRAQEARRVIDRLVGWMVSNPLSRLIGERASAGRVQSPALGLVVERERQIKAFVKEQNFGAEIDLGGWIAAWVPGEKCKNRAEAERASAVKTFRVVDYVERDEAETPPPPFDTALLQQAASVTLKIDPEGTMKIAQRLFEAGLITYHRTDEANLSEEAFQMIVDFAKPKGLPTIPARRKFKSAAGAQEAHEAIRPTHFDADISELADDEKALYGLIFKRAVACQLSDAVYAVRRIKLNGDDMTYTAVGRVVKTSGWRALGVAAEVEEDEKEEIPENPIPSLSVGDVIAPKSGKVTESWTRAPSRYTKASLVKTLKALGIGRPATYAPSVDGIEKKGYVALQNRHIVPTPLAEKIYDALKGKFKFIEVDFTKRLEEALDAIHAGTRSYEDVVHSMHEVLKAELLAIGVVHSDKNREQPKPAIDAAGEVVKCPKCGKKMIQRTSARGSFLGCSAYPKCTGTKQISTP